MAWLRPRWREGGAVPLISPATARELTRVLAYPKFRLSKQYSMELLTMYIPYCESFNPADKCPIECRDSKDQPLLDLAQSSKADLLVTGDDDLLALVGQTEFTIETPENYRRRVSAEL